MRLTDLNPQWFYVPGRWGVALCFDCPCIRCRSGQQTQVRLVASISPPLDEGEPIVLDGHKVNLALQKGHMPPGRYVGCSIAWHRTGCSFSDLSLSPSLNFEASEDWHGFIQNGQVT